MFPEKIILHIDFDSFFASVEQQKNSLLRGRPVGVTATNGRTCIIAASREAKALGIKSPSRTFDAKRICPSIVFVPADFVNYWNISKKFLKICNNYSPVVEVFSLDEVFMDATLTAPLFGGVEGLIKKLKKELAQEIGEYITVSVGISHNKILAKLASGMKKPDGAFEINKENLTDIYKKAKLTDICGIGNRIEVRLNQMGIYSLVQLSKCPLNYLIAEFGESEGNFLFNVGRGVDQSNIVPYAQFPGVKSVGRSYCLPVNEYDMRKATQNIYELCEEVALKLRRLNKKARGVGFCFRGNKDISGRKTFGTYMNTGRELFEACMNNLNSNFQYLNPKQFQKIKYKNTKQFDNYNFENLDLFSVSGLEFRIFEIKYLRQISIWTFSLKNADSVPLSFFETAKSQKLLKTIDILNTKFGDHTIRNGYLLDADKLTTVPNGFGADRYERKKLTDESRLV